MAFHLLPFLGQGLASIGSFFTGLVMARNSDQASAIAIQRENLEREVSLLNRENQLNIAADNMNNQFAITERNLTQAKELAEQQRLTQLKLAFLTIANQNKLEQNRQGFQRDIEKDRQKFQERMEHLRIGSQLNLEEARQSFELERQKLSQDHQEKLTKFVQGVNIAINQQNLEFNKWRIEQEGMLQTKLAKDNCNTQLMIAKIHCFTQLMSPMVNKMWGNWPLLNLIPIQILNSHAIHGRVPLRIFISPPEIDYDRFGNQAKKFPQMEKRIAEGLRKFLSPNYPLNNEIRPIELLDGGWESKRFRGGSTIKALFGMLKSEPTLILESEVEEGYLNLKVAYWGLGQDTYCYERIISGLPYQDILFELAKKRALHWQSNVKTKLLNKGMSLQKINEKYGQDNAINLAILKEDIEFIKDGIIIPRSYHVNNQDWNKLCDILVNCHCLIAAWIADAHFLINYDVDPLLPELLPSLLTDELALPINEVIQAVVSGYKDLFKAIEIEQPHRIPDLALKLAKGFAKLPDKSFANELLDYSLKAKLNL